MLLLSSESISAGRSGWTEIVFLPCSRLTEMEFLLFAVLLAEKADPAARLKMTRQVIADFLVRI